MFLGGFIHSSRIEDALLGADHSEGIQKSIALSYNFVCFVVLFSHYNSLKKLTLPYTSLNGHTRFATFRSSNVFVWRSEFDKSNQGQKEFWRTRGILSSVVNAMRARRSRGLESLPRTCSRKCDKQHLDALSPKAQTMPHITASTFSSIYSPSKKVSQQRGFPSNFQSNNLSLLYHFTKTVGLTNNIYKTWYITFRNVG